MIKGLALGKKGRLYVKFIVAVAIIAAALYSYSVLASAPVATPSIVNTNGTTVNGAFITNASVARATDRLFTNVNFSSENASTEVNSTFKWFKRTLYQPQNRSLVGYWKLDGNANDSSSYGNHGTIISATPNQSQDCRIDDCMFFDGVDDYVNLSDSGSLTISNSITVEAWFNGRNFVSSQSIVGKGSTAAADGYNGYYLRVNVDKIEAILYTGTNTETVLTGTSPTVANNSWNHAAFTYDGSNLRLYLNGAQVNSAAVTGLIDNTGGFTDVKLGKRRSNGDYDPFNGSIDEVAIYNYAKSAAEIQADFKNSPYSAMVYKDAIGYWHLDENGGSNYLDSSGNGLSGNGPNLTNGTGIINGGVVFNGTYMSGEVSQQNISVAHSAVLNVSRSNFTVSAWINTYNSTASQIVVIKNYGIQGGGAATFSIWLTGGKPTSRMNFERSGNSGQNAANTIIKNNTWYNVVFTWNRTNGCFWVNGKFDACTEQDAILSGGGPTGANLSVDDRRLTIGNRAASDLPFWGTIDELAIYNRSLSAEEIKQLYLRTWYDHSPQQFLLHPNYPDELDNSTQNTTLLLHFNDGSPANPNASDSSPYLNHGNISGAAFVNDSISGSALVFDGTNDYVNLSASATMLPTAAITVSGWVKFSNPGTDNPLLASSWWGSNWAGYNLFIHSSAVSAPQWIIGNSGTNFVRVNGSGAINDNKWHYVAATFDGAAQTAAIYVDGALKNKTSVPFTTLGYASNSCATVTVGDSCNFPSVTDGGIIGVMDEVKIVNRSLTAAEVAADFRKGCPFCSSDGELPTATSGVVWQPGKFVENLSAVKAGAGGNVTGYWRFDDLNSGSDGARDLSGSGNNGTILGGAAFVNDSAGGYALDFDGVDDNVTVAHSSSTDVKYPFTVEMWFKADSAGEGLIKKTTGGADSSVGWWIFYLDTNSFSVGITDGVATRHTNTYNAFVPLNEWHHIAWVVESSEHRFYVNGNLVGSTSHSEGSVSNSDPLIIGRGTVASEFWNGKIDEVRIINRSLNASEVLADYRKAAKGLGLLSNDYINYSASGNFNEKEGTVEFWVKPEWNGNDGLAHHFFDTDADSANARRMALFKTSANDLGLYDWQNDRYIPQYSISNWLSGDWHHVAASWNNYTSNATLFIDGLKVNQSSSAFDFGTGRSRVIIGSRVDTPAQTCNCTISEFRISRKALSAQEINESFSKSRQLYSNEFMLNSSNYQKGDAFKLQYTPGDSQATTGTSSNSSFITVVNSVQSEPTVTDFGLAGTAGSVASESVAANRASSATPLNATFMSAINITWNPSADNDSDTISYDVLINNTLACATTATSCNTTQLPGWTFAAGAAFYIFNVTAFDGEVNATTTTYAFNFDNSTPTVSLVAITTANNTFQNTTSYFINLSVTEANIDRFILNITGPSFAGAGGDGALSSGKNITLWDRDLVGMWHFEENGGLRNGTANDSSGFRNHGTLTDMNVSGNATSGWTAARLGGGLNFDGLNDIVSIPSSSSLGVGPSGSFSFWIKRANWSTANFAGDEGVIGDNLASSANNALYFSLHNAVCLHFRYGGTSQGGNTYLNNCANNNWANDTWHHIAAVWSNAGSSTNLYMYADGSPISSGSASLVISLASSAWNFGGRDSAAFKGTLDEVKFWRRPLTEADVSAEYSLTASNYLASHNFSGSSHLFSVNLTNLTQGNYSYFAWVNDTASAVGTTAAAAATTNIGQRLFAVDTIAPSITLAANTPANQSVLGSSFIFVNTSENDAGNNHNDFSAFVDFNNSLVGYWRFEDEGDTNASDFTGNNNNGTLVNFGCLGLNCNLTGGSRATGSGWTSAGRRGRGLVFDGENDYVNVSLSPSLNITTSNFSISVWMKRASALNPVEVRGIIRSNVYGFEEASAGVNFLITTNGGGTYPATGTYSLTNDSWHFVTGVYNSSHILLYVDGVLRKTNSVSGGLSPLTNGSITIGSEDGVSNCPSCIGTRYFNGTIDEVMIWGRALSDQEVNASYSAGSYRLFSNITNLADGNYSFRAFVVDAAGNMNQTANTTFTVDTTAPTISFIVPTDANASFLNRSWTLVNTSTTETSEHSAFVDFNRSLVGYWRFEDDGDSNATDSGTYNNNASLINFSCYSSDCNITGAAGAVASGFISAGKRGKGLALDGVGTEARVTSTNALKVESGNFTLEAWAKFNGLGGTAQSLIAKTDSSGTVGWSFSVRSDVVNLVKEGVANQNVNLISPLNNRTLYHLAVTQNSTHASYYVNGAFQAQFTSSAAFLSSGNNLLRIGNGRDGLLPVNGTVDEVKVWNRALSAAEINASYQAGTYRLSANLSGLNDGNYSYYAAVVDSAGTLVQTANRTIYVDTAAPSISLVANTPANASTLATNFIFINTSENDAGNNHNDFSAFVDFNNSLVGYWRFEDDGDTNASDFTSNNNNGSMFNFGCTELNCNLTGGSGGTGGGWTSGGKRGKALAFDGVATSVNVSDNSALSFPSKIFTLSAWIKTSSTSDNVVLHKGNLNNYEYEMATTTGGATAQVGVWNAAGDNSIFIQGMITINNSNWHQIVGVGDGTNLTLYVDGVRENSSIIPVAMTDGNSPFEMGRRIDRTTGFFNGSIDEVMVWNRALNGTEINASFSAGTYRLFNNFTGLPDGNYSFRAFVVDASGNINQTANTTVTVVDVTTCKSLDRASYYYTLIQSVSGSGTCFTIGANNITLDCAGYTITYATSEAGKGVDDSGGYDNVTIKNCVINQGGSATANNNGIYFVGVTGSIINNNTINGSGTSNNHVIRIDTSSNNNNVSSNTINTSGSAGSNSGILLISSSANNTVSSNTIRTSGTNDNYGIRLVTSASSNNITGNTINTSGTSNNYGIIISASGNNSVISNTINTTGSASTNYGVYIVSSSPNNNVTGNTIRTGGTSSNYGIALTSTVSGNNVSINTITTTGTFSNFGIFLQTSAINNTVSNNSIRTGGSSSDNYGIVLSSTVTNNVISGNAVNTSGTSGNRGIQLDTTANNNTLTENKVNASGSSSGVIGIVLESTANNNTVSGNTIQTSGNGNAYGIQLAAASSNSVTGNTVSSGIGPEAAGNTGIYLSDGSGTGNNVSSNIINTSGTTSNTGLEIYPNNTVVSFNAINTSGSIAVILRGNSTTVASNTIRAGTTAIAFVTSNASYNNLTSNTVIVIGASNLRGISIAPGSNNRVSFNIINVTGTTGSRGINFQVSSDNNVVLYNNITSNSTSTSNPGVHLSQSRNNNFTGNVITVLSGTESHGIYILTGTNGSNITGNTIKTTGAGSFAVQVDNDGNPNNNTLYNNVFNTTARHVNVTTALNVNNFSTALITATNIIGGANIGGNFYDNSTVGGLAAWSLNCTQRSTYGICDVSLTHTGNNTDFYPLAAPDTTNPFIDYGLNSDSNNTFVPRNWVFLNFSYTELNNNTFMIRNGSTNWTNVNATAINSTAGFFYYNFTNLPDGNYSFFGWINDSAGNVNQTVNRTIVIDATAPAIAYLANTEADGSAVTKKWIFVNVSVVDTYVKNVTIELWNTTHMVNRTNFTNVADNNFSINFTAFTGQESGAEGNLSEGTYYFNATAFDLALNRQSTTTRTVAIDLNQPKIDFGLGVHGNNTHFNRNFLFLNFSFTETYNRTFTIINATSSDAAIANNTGNAVTAGGSNIDGSGFFYRNFTTLADANYSFIGWINDSAGKGNQTLNRTFTVDTTVPTINAVRIASNNSPYFWQGTNSTSAVTAYFNREDGRDLEAVIEVQFSDTYRHSLSGNDTFGETPANFTPGSPTRLRYTIEATRGNASTNISANDTANNTATATITWVLDINDTTTTDNSSSSSTWFSTNVTINLTASDAHSGANHTYYCTYTAGTQPCTPTLAVTNTYAFLLPINCSTGNSCQTRIRYYSMDNVSNNESGGANGGSIRESNTVNIGTGGSDVQDSLVNNSAIQNDSFIRTSNLTNSTVNNCRVTGSVIVRSTLFRSINYVRNCTVSDSFVLDSNITSSIIERQSYVDPSIITDSVITNSTIHNSTVSYSRIENSTFCGNFSVWTAAILNNTLIDGRIVFNGSNYFGPAALSSICAGVPSSPLGSLVADPSIVNNSAAVVFRYASASTGYSVTIGQNDLFTLDNTSTKPITLNDNGTYPDVAANDAIYSGNYTMSPLNNQSDGNKTIMAQVFDNLGNNWTVRTNVTLDNTTPYAAIVVNSNSVNSTSAYVTLNVTFSDAIGVKDCRFANEDRVFGSFESCSIVKSWTLSSGNGVKTVVVQVRDTALNVNETNDTISLLAPATTITTPLAGDIVKGSKNVVVIAPDIAAWVTFVVINSTNSTQNWSLSGAVGGITNDTSPGDGFVQPWATTLFGNESVVNITATAYGASGSFLSNDTQGNIQVDNAPPNVTLDIPKASTAYNRLVRVNASASNDTVSVRFDYRTSSTADWSTIGTAYTFPYTVDWSTGVLADGTAYEVRANATDDAGWSSLSTHTAVELDNTGPSVSITAPVAGATISGTFNVTFTILGTVLSRAIQFDGGLWQATTGNTSHLWDTTTVADGAHLIRVQANDTLNNTGYSEIMIVQVDNGGANVVLLSPASGGYKSGNVTLEVSAPGNTFNVTFNISNSTGFFNTTANVSAVTVDNVSGNGWTANWVTTLFAEDGTYTVSVAAYTSNNSLIGSDSATGIEVDNVVPNNVTNLTILPHPNSNSGTLTLNWTTSTSADLSHYNLHRSQSGNFTVGSGTFVKSVGTNTTTDNVPAGTWFYRVVAVDNVGRESNASNEVNSTVTLAGPTGGLDINASYARNNDTIKLTYTGSGTGFTVIVNASEMMKLDARVMHDFEKLWVTSSNNSLNLTLNSTATKAGSFSVQLRTNESGALNQNVTVDLSAAGIVNLSSYNRLVLWVRSNITGNVLNFTFGSDNYTQAGNFTVTIDAANTWEHKVFDISSIPVNGTAGNRSSIRYIMFNVTTATPMRLLVDDLEASNQVSLPDDGTGVDSLASDSTYTGSYNITFGQNVTDGLKTVRALVTDGSGNTLAPSDTITLDNTAPFSAVIINEGDLFTTSRTVALNLTFSDATAGISQCRYSNTQPVTSTYESCQLLKVWTTTTGGGTKTVFYEVRDSAGNTNVSNDTITLDTSVPEMIITYPAPGAVVNGTINITFSGAESTQPQFSFDGSNWSNTTAVNFHIWNTTNLSEGTHSIRVRDTDPAGNIGYSEPLLVIVNNIQGIVSFITPQNNEILTGNVIVRVTATEEVKNVSFIIFNTTSGQSVQVYNDTYALDGWNFTLNTALYEDGVWELKANATNSFNVLIDAAIVNNLRFDNVAPTATLQAPANGASVRGTVIINVTASSDAKQVVFEYSNDSGTGWQPLGIDFSPSGGWTLAWFTNAVNDASTYRVRANVSDYAGLSTIAQNTADFTIDNTPPKLNIIVPVAGSTVSGTVNVSFSGGERHPMVSIDGGTVVNASSVQNYTWNTAAIADGAHTIRINDSDALGNIGYSDTVLVYVDNTPDVVSIVSPPRTTASAAGNLEVIVVAPSNTRFVLFNVSNSTFNNMTVAGSQGITNDTTPADGWRQTVTTATFADGLYNISVAAYNELGNLTGRDNITNIEFDNSAPSAPTLRALPQFDTDGVVQLEWSNVTASVSDVIYYSIYRSANISFALSASTRIKNVSANFNTTTDFPGVNAKYYYKVTAVDNALFESPASNEENTTVSVTAGGALVGVLSANDTIVKDGDAVVFRYSSSATDLNVTMNSTEMQRLDNSTRLDLRLLDSGGAPDAVADDAVYTASFTISTANNQSDGNVQLRAIVNDSANNQFLPTVNITLDNTAPNASIIINNGDANTSSATVTIRLGFNDTLGGVQSCRLADENRQFGEWEPCVAQRSWELSSGNGLKTVVLQVKDNADNVNETNDTITYQALAAVTILRPATDAALAGNALIEAVGPATAAKMEFRIYNGTSYWPVGAGSAGSTNDSTPETGFSATWATSSFVDTIYNLTAIAYDASGNYIANDTNTNIEVDNTAPAAVTLTPLPAFFNKNILSLNWSPSSSSDVVYYNVYRSNNVSFQLSSGALLKNASSNSTVDTVLDGQWFYKVTAVDNTGKESAASNEVNVTVITGAPPSELYGVLSVNATVVRNGSSVLFAFAGSATNLNVTINQSEMRRLDNTSGAISLNDSGINGDYLADDATYSAVYQLSMLNNESDGLKQLTAEVNDSAGNLFRPKVNITLDNTRPNATITIFGLSPAGFGNVSGEYTFSRAVTLATVFNDTFGVGSCRFANENQVFADWEGCTAAKSWLLSDGNGNKTVVLEVRDVAGNVNRTNDTIYLNTTAAGLDQSAPTTPTVVDDGLYTNVNVALHARWNATDYENDLLHIPLEWEYRIGFDNFTRRLNDTWQYAGIATETTVYGLNLSDGTNYTFEVRAINTAGIRSTNGTSDGITVDTTPPSSPLVNSTASQTSWTSSNAVTFNFTATDNVSGVSSFSYVLDSNATTVPDNVPESMSQHTLLSGSYNDGKSTLLKFNSTGNASAVFIEIKSNASANDVVRVTLQLAESSVESSDALGYVVYAITSPPTGFDMTGSNISRIVNTSQDIAFVSSLLDASTYTVDVPLSTAVAGSRFFVAVAGDQNDDNNRLNLLLSVSNTSIDSSTQSYQCREGVSGCSNTTATADYGIKAELRDLKQDNIWHRAYTVGDGRLHFHVKAKDSAGNIGGTANYTVLVDTSAPSIPQMNQTSQYTNTTSASFNWTASTDADSGVGNYSLQVDNNSDFSSPEYYQWVGNITNKTVTGLTADATYFARVHSSNLAGVNSSWSTSVSTVVDTTAPSITFSKPSSTGVVASQDVTLATQTNERAICTYSGNGGADPYQNFTYTNSTYHEVRVSAATGSNTYSVQCKDTVLNTGTATLTFTVSTSSTASSITLQSPSVFTGDVVRTDAIVTTSSGQRLGEIGSAAFTVKLNGDAVGLSVFDNGAGNYTLVFDAPSTNGTYTMAVTVGSATASSTLNVQALLFTVQYVQSGVAANTGDRLIYFVAGNFSLGLATDSKNVMRSSTSSALNLTSNARDGTAYIFVTRTGGNVERMESLLKEQKFLDTINPSFGYAINLDTFVVYTDLEYDSIALSGNKTLTTGRYNLIIENKGFDTSVNKTKLEVRVQ